MQPFVRTLYDGHMNDGTPKTVQMQLVSPNPNTHGSTDELDDFEFEMQPRVNPGRTIRYALTTEDAESLHLALGVYIKKRREP